MRQRFQRVVKPDAQFEWQNIMPVRFIRSNEEIKWLKTMLGLVQSKNQINNDYARLLKKKQQCHYSYEVLFKIPALGTVLGLGSSSNDCWCYEDISTSGSLLIFLLPRGLRLLDYLAALFFLLLSLLPAQEIILGGKPHHYTHQSVFTPDQVVNEDNRRHHAIFTNCFSKYMDQITA